MLPSRGYCHAVFLLAYSARLKPPPDLQSWISSARGRDTLMAAALNLDGVAKTLVALNLVRASGQSVVISRSLTALSYCANTETFTHLARLLLERAPPPWLRVAVTENGVCREFIPEAELEIMAWLDDRLDALLIEVYSTIGDKWDDTFRKRIGDAAEQLVIAALRRVGGDVVHVAALSDRFGYDIEHRTSDGVQRLEVKAVTSRTSPTFFLSRNEFDKSQLFGNEWRLVQVIFTPNVLLAQQISGAHVVEVRELTSGKLRQLVPPDTGEFEWQESARLSPPAAAWGASAIHIGPFDAFTDQFLEGGSLPDDAITEILHSS